MIGKARLAIISSPTGRKELVLGLVMTTWEIVLCRFSSVDPIHVGRVVVVGLSLASTVFLFTCFPPFVKSIPIS